MSPRTSALGLISLTRVSEPQRTLLLMRHAKSAYPPDVADHDRPLAPRGIREAGLAGDWLRANAPSIDAVLCSTATRTRQTLAQTGIDASVRYSERLYGATPGTMIDEINGVADSVNTLLVVGHEPTMSSAVHRPGGPRRHRRDSGATHFGEIPDVSDRGADVAGDWKRRRTQHSRAHRVPRPALNSDRYELVASVSSMSLMACPHASMPGA